MLRILMLLLPLTASAETLKLRSKAEVNAVIAGLEGGRILLQDGRKLPRAEVEEIVFAQKEAAKPASAVVASPEDKARSAELFKEAAEFGELYPDMDGLILQDHGEFVLREDGTWLYRSRFIGQVLKDDVKRQWGTLMEYFEDGRSRAQILKATVYLPDGRVLPLDPDRVSVTRPQSGDLFFTSYRFVNYSVPGLEKGAIIETVTEREEYNPFRKDFFFPAFYFQGYQPIKSTRLSITVPKSVRLEYAAKHFDGKLSKAASPSASEAGGDATYAWELRDMPPIIPEPEMNQPGDFVPRVAASVFKGWGPILSWLRKMYEERTAPGPALTRFTQDLVKDAKTDDEKVAAIYHYLQKRIRYIAVKMGVASGWGGYDANLTFERQYGCCIDKALLFTAMLKVAGIESTPLLVDTNYAADHEWDIPDIAFQHAINLVKLPGRRLVLDSTGYDYRYPYFADMDHGVGSLNVFDGKVESVPVPAPADNSSTNIFNMRVLDNGNAFVNYAAKPTGPREAAQRGYYKRIKDAELKKMFQGRANRVSAGAELLLYKLYDLDDVSKPFTLELEYQMPGYAIRAGDLRIVKLPEFVQSFDEVSLEKRAYDIEYRSSFERRYSYVIDIPKRYEVAFLPEKVKFKDKHGAFEAGCRAEDNPASGRKVVCGAVLQVTSRVIPAADYPEYRSFLRRVSRYTENQLFFRETP
ncbi:MAG: DUF3857 domain-containing protein [Elusimicrobiota bacterium]